MSLFRRATASAPTVEKRQLNDTDALARAILLGGSPTSAGQYVSPARSESIMAVWRCKQMIADIVSGLPVEQFRETSEDGRKEITRSPFVDDPSDFVTAHDWRFQIMWDALTYGNGLAYATRFDRSGWVLKAESVSWSDVSVERKGAFAAPTWKINGTAVDPDRVIHLPAFGPKPGSVLGMSPLAAARETIGLGLAVREFGSNWYDSGGHPTTLLTTEIDLDDIAANAAKEKFRSATRGDHIAVMGNAWDIKSVQVSPDDALFLSAMNITAIDVCGFYGMPSELLGYAPAGKGSITYANREQRAIDVLVFTLQWWIGRLERCISRHTPRGQVVKINMDAFLRSDAATRWGIHKIAVDIGARNIDEVRQHEDEDPLPDGQGQTYYRNPNPTPSPASPAPTNGDTP
jgi:HK97 family phage portal protein